MYKQYFIRTFESSDETFQILHASNLHAIFEMLQNILTKLRQCFANIDKFHVAKAVTQGDGRIVRHLAHKLQPSKHVFSWAK